MGHRLRVSPQTFAVLDALLRHSSQWRHGYWLSLETELPSGTLYPILMRLEKLGWLEARWEEPKPGRLGRPPRHLYKLTGQGRAWAVEELSAIRAKKIWKPVRNEA